MGLLDALGLKPTLSRATSAPAASKAGARTGPRAAPLKDADFGADARRRRAADEEARRLGKQRLDAKDPVPGKGPAVDPLDAKIDKLIGDPEERIKAMAQWKVPTFSEQFDADTPEIRFLADLESGTKKAAEGPGQRRALGQVDRAAVERDGAFPRMAAEQGRDRGARRLGSRRCRRGDPNSAAAAWWDCLVPDDAPVAMAEDGGDDGTSDERDEFEIGKRKATADLEDAGIEVRQFLELASACPLFQAIHDGEWKKYLATRR